MLYLMTFYTIILKFGDVTIYPYKYCKIQVARGNFSYYEIHPLAKPTRDNTLMTITITHNTNQIVLKSVNVNLVNIRNR